MTRLTHSVTSPPSIAALRKVYSINSSAVASIVDGTFKPGAFAAIVSRLAIICPFSNPNIRDAAQLQLAKLIASETAPTMMRLAAQLASRLNQLRETNLRPR